MEPAHTRTYHELDYAAGSWPQSFRVVLKAEVMSCDDNPRFVVTSLRRPTPENLYGDLYCARGQDRSVAVLRMRNGTSQSPFRLALGDNPGAPVRPAPGHGYVTTCP